MVICSTLAAIRMLWRNWSGFEKLVWLDPDHFFADGPKFLLVLLVHSSCWGRLLNAVAVVHSALAFDGIVKGAVEGRLGSVKWRLGNKIKNGLHGSQEPVGVQVPWQFSCNDTCWEKTSRSAWTYGLLEKFPLRLNAERVIGVKWSYLNSRVGKYLTWTILAWNDFVLWHHLLAIQ